MIVEASSSNSLPADVLWQSMVIPSNAADVNQLTVKVQSELLKVAAVTVGTVLGHLCVADVTTVSKQQPESDFMPA